MSRIEALDDALAQLTDDETAHVIRLVTAWGMLADFCFADLVLYLPIEDRHRYAEGTDSDDARFVMVNHVRPSTSPTIYHSDLIGEVRTTLQRPLVTRSYLTGELAEGEIDSVWLDSRVRVRCIPVRHRSRIIGVLARESATTLQRQRGELEATYVGVFERFATMIAEGAFPFADEDEVLSNPPRVGDGVVVVDRDGVVDYASPNAVSALVRAGADGNLRGRDLSEVGMDRSAVRIALRTARPTVDEIEATDQVTIALRCIPLVEHGEVTGAVILSRDISELVRRDRMLMSKDATIREIHHRVKNNLQTISSLLRLQGRRLAEPSAKAAIEQSVRRIHSIALVHETLSRTAGDDVRFIDVVRPVVRMVEDGLTSPEHPVRFEVHGDGGVVPSPTATSMAVVLCELLQNVVEHAFPADGDQVLPAHEPDVSIELFTGRDGVGPTLGVIVTDNGVGLGAAGGAGLLEDSDSLGLSIVQTLVRSELRGSIEHSPGTGVAPWPGTSVRIVVPVGGVADNTDL